MVESASPPALEPLGILARRYGAGAPVVVELIRRTGGCTSPIRLEGEAVAVSLGTGAVLARRSTRSHAPGFVLVACGNRRESRCPPCSERYRRDAYFLVAAGLAGDQSRGVSPSVASHPLVFATFTAPPFGAVHRRVVDAGGVRPCRPGGPEICEHGAPMRCLERHTDTDPRIGQALCPCLLRLRGRGALEREPRSPVAPNDHVPAPRARGPVGSERGSPATPGSASPTPRSPSSRPVDRSTSMRSSASTDPTVPTPRRRAERRRSF